MCLKRLGSRAFYLLILFACASVNAQTNLALNAPASGSTNVQPGNLATDGNASTRWESAYGVDPSWLTVDLGSQKSLASAQVVWEAANAENYLIQGSNNNADWTTLSIFTGGAFGNRTDNHTISGSYRWVRMHGTHRSVGNNWGYSIFEFRVFGAASSSSSSSTSGNCNLGCVNTINGNTMRATVSAGNIVDIHYRVNGGSQQNFGMTLNNGVWTYDIGNLPAGATVSVSFTIITNGVGNTTAWNDYTLGSAPSSSSSSSSSTSSSSSSTSTPSGTNITGLGGAITAQYNNSPAGEGITNLIDNNVNTKFLTVASSSWVRYQTPASYIVTGYTLTSANDAPERDPLSWSLQGSNNGSSWTTIDSRSAQDFPNRFQTRAFTFNNSTGYTYYRFNFSNNSGTMTQLAEMKLYGTLGGGTTSSSSSSSSSVPLGNIVPLYNSSTQLEPTIRVQQGNQLITRIADRARDRHAKESHFQSYDHFLSFYWEHRTASIEIIETQFPDDTASIRMNVRTQWRLNDTEAENRWFYRGIGTVAEYCDNGTMVVVNDLNYYKERTHNCRTGQPIRKGDKLEFELSQFLDPSVPRGRAPYYGTTYLYIVGEGIVPWDILPGTFNTPTFGGGTKDSVKIPSQAWLGGGTTLPYDHSNEPDNHYIQMATNLGYNNGQPFVLGRRVHHTSFVDGTHDEHVENGVFDGMPGKAGPHYVNDRCTGCHVRNGRAAPANLGEPLDKWVFKVGDANGNPHPQLARTLQPKSSGGAASEGVVSLQSWSNVGGLREPNYQFSGVQPATFSARIAPSLVGIGLLEAIPESAILAKEDPSDANGDGISGRANRVIDPVTGQTRLGRFGYKAGTSSVKHQVASALNNDMGVRTSVLPNPDCGSGQSDCGPSGSELSDTHLNNLVKYNSLLGVRPQRNINDAAVQRGKTQFTNIGCAGCHTASTYQTSANHPLGELRSQTIQPYTDLLLHDMGPGLADNLGEGQASGSEWRTAPLWGLGLSACVTGGVTNAGQGQQVCTPVHSYLHDGRARSIEEAILWHGGEGENAKNAYQALGSSQKQDVLRFLESL